LFEQAMRLISKAPEERSEDAGEVRGKLDDLWAATEREANAEEDDDGSESWNSWKDDGECQLTDGVKKGVAVGVGVETDNAADKVEASDEMSANEASRILDPEVQQHNPLADTAKATKDHETRAADRGREGSDVSNDNTAIEISGPAVAARELDRANVDGAVTEAGEKAKDLVESSADAAKEGVKLAVVETSMERPQVELAVRQEGVVEAAPCNTNDDRALVVAVETPTEDVNAEALIDIEQEGPGLIADRALGRAPDDNQEGPDMREDHYEFEDDIEEDEDELKIDPHGCAVEANFEGERQVEYNGEEDECAEDAPADSHVPLDEEEEASPDSQEQSSELDAEPFDDGPGEMKMGAALQFFNTLDGSDEEGEEDDEGEEEEGDIDDTVYADRSEDEQDVAEGDDKQKDEKDEESLAEEDVSVHDESEYVDSDDDEAPSGASTPPI